MTTIMKRTTAALAGLFLAAAAPQAAENLIFNPGFELGDSGTGFIKTLRPDTNPKQLFEGPVTDTSVAASQGKALRVPNRFAEKCDLYFKEFKLKPGTEYTFSAMTRSSVPNRLVLVEICSAPRDPKLGWAGKSAMLKAGLEWSRQAYAFKTPSPWPNEWYQLRVVFGKEKDSPPGDLWLDDVQLVEGRSTEYRRGAALEAAATAGRLYYVADGRTPVVDAKLVVHNGSDSESVNVLRVLAVDDHDRKQAFSKDFKVRLKPGESVELPFEIPNARFGAYRLETKLLDAGETLSSHPGFFSVIGKYEPKPIDVGKTSCVGLNMLSANYVGKHLRGWRRAEASGFNCDGYSTEDYMKLMADMGCRLVRDFGESSSDWRSYEPEEGRFDPDNALLKTLDIYARHGISVMPVLGAGFGGLPPWLEAKSEKIENSGDWKKTVFLPPMERWRAYVGDVAARCKGRVPFYEITNEPNGWLAADKYVEYLKAACEEIKKADPNAKVVGFCCTGDLGGDLEGFMGKCCKLGGLKYADAVSFHPYDAPNLASPKAADRQLEELRGLLTQNGGADIPLWDTELFYLRGQIRDQFGADCLASERHQPYHVAWRFLTDLGEGVTQDCVLLDRQIFRNALSPHAAGGIQSQHIPSGDFVVYNALARLFEGAKPCDKIRWGNDTVCYVYERDGKPIAAFWNHGDMKRLKLRLDPDEVSRLKLFDLYGNETPVPENGVLTLGPEPFYLAPSPAPWFDIFAGEISAKDFDALLKNGKVEAERPINVAQAARFVPDNGGWAIAIPFRNCAGRDLAGELGVQGEGIDSAGRVKFSVPAGGEIAVPAPLRLKAEKQGEIIAKFVIDGKSWDEKLNVAPPAKVSRPGERAQVGPASMRVDGEGKALKLSFDVKDGSPSGPAAGRPFWEQDCVELFLDAEPLAMPSKHSDVYTDGVTRLFITPYAPKGTELVVWSKTRMFAGTKATVSTWKGGYSVNLEIPLSAVKGKCLGFEAQIDDADAVRRQASFNWNSRGDACSNRLSFGFIDLESPKPLN